MTVTTNTAYMVRAFVVNVKDNTRLSLAIHGSHSLKVTSPTYIHHVNITDV